jgi:hypothetical protein
MTERRTSSRTHKKVIRDDDETSDIFIDDDDEGEVESEDEKSSESQTWQPNASKFESSDSFDEVVEDEDLNETDEPANDLEEEDDDEMPEEKPKKQRSPPRKKISPSGIENLGMNKTKLDVKVPIKETIEVSPKKKFKVPSAVKKDGAGRKELLAKKLSS